MLHDGATICLDLGQGSFAYGLGHAYAALAAAGFESLAFRRRAGDPRAGASVDIPDPVRGRRHAPNERRHPSL